MWEKNILITFGWDTELCETIVWIWYLWWIQEPPEGSLISFIYVPPILDMPNPSHEKLFCLEILKKSLPFYLFLI